LKTWNFLENSCPLSPPLFLGLTGRGEGGIRRGTPIGPLGEG